MKKSQLAKLRKIREKYIKSRKHSTMDYLMDCPNCGRHNAMEREGNFWHCLWRDCGLLLSETDLEEIDKFLASKEISQTLNLSFDQAERILDILDTYGYGR